MLPTRYQPPAPKADIHSAHSRCGGVARVRRVGGAVRSARGFSLVEILVVLAIAGIAMASVMQAAVGFNAVFETQVRLLKLDRYMRSATQTIESALTSAGAGLDNATCDLTNGWRIGVALDATLIGASNGFEWRRAVYMRNHRDLTGTSSDQLWVYRAHPNLTWTIVPTPGTTPDNDPFNGPQPNTPNFAPQRWIFTLSEAAGAYNATKCGTSFAPDLLCVGHLIVVWNGNHSDVLRVTQIDTVSGTNDLRVTCAVSDSQNRTTMHRWYRDERYPDRFFAKYGGYNRTFVSRFVAERFIVDNTWSQSIGYLFSENYSRSGIGGSYPVPYRSMLAQNVVTLQAEVGVSTASAQVPYRPPADMNEYRLQGYDGYRLIGPKHIVDIGGITSVPATGVFGYDPERINSLAKAMNMFLMLRMTNPDRVPGGVRTASERDVVNVTGSQAFYSATNGLGYIADYQLAGTNDGINRRMWWRLTDLENSGYGESFSGSFYQVLVGMPGGAKKCPTN
jgi:prepilin-type N-terminal cleavage/methylation domain-containing protein